MGKVYVFDHPLIQHKVALMRQKDTNVKDFRELAKEVAMVDGGKLPIYRFRYRDKWIGFYRTGMGAPLAVALMEEVEIETPMCKTKVNMLKGEDVAIVPILRAGLGFVDGMLALVPNAKVGHEFHLLRFLRRPR